MEKKIVRQFETTRGEILNNSNTKETRLDAILDWFYNIIPSIKNSWRDFKWCFKNHIKFHKVLKEWRPWDYRYQTNMFAFCLEQLAEHIKNGYEEEVSRDKKVAAIGNLVRLLRIDFDDMDYEVYKKIVIPTIKNDKITVTEYSDGTRSYKPEKTIEREIFDEYVSEAELQKDIIYQHIFDIIKGQTHRQIKEQAMAIVGDKESYANEIEYNNKLQEMYDSLFDGTGIEMWWT